MFEVIDVDGTLYHVQFQHCDWGEPGNKHYRKITWCFISYDQGGWGDLSICNPVDNFNKSTGRKVALSHALSGVSRESRKLFWEKYFEVYKR